MASSPAKDPHKATEKPPSLIYGLEDRPSLASSILLSFERVALIYPNLIFVTVISKSDWWSARDDFRIRAWAMIAISATTILQTKRIGPIGARFLASPVIAIYFAFSAETS
jgi:xanthine/uracil permease